MPPPRKKQKEIDGNVPMNADIDEEEPSSPSCTVVSNAASASMKLKCLKCFRAARKDCTGNLCIRCCTDENCVAHQELRAKAKWKEQVMEGTTEIQRRAKHKRSRAIPKGRFKEKAFQYMNDTVVLWDLRTVLDPSLPRQPISSSVDHSPTKDNKRGSTTVAFTSNSSSTAPVSAAVMAQYQHDLKVKDEILRRSRKNNQSSSEVKTKLRRNYRGTRKRFRSVMETLYQKSLD